MAHSFSLSSSLCLCVSVVQMPREKEPATSKRRHGKRATTAAATSAPARRLAAPDLPISFGAGSVAELIRRSLLVLTVGVLVARPLVSGEDPGLLSDTSDASGLFLTLLTCLIAIGWTLWRVLAGRPEWHGGFVEVGLLLVVAVTFIAAESAPYRHAAYLIGWDWASLLLLFIVVRQLAVAADDQRRLVAVLLATALAVSVNAGYQVAIEIPKQHRDYRTEAELRQKTFLDEVDPAGDIEWQRLQEGRASAPFMYPQTLAGYLALALPILGGAWLAARRSGASRNLMAALVVAILMVVGALFLTGCVAAVLAVVVVAVVAAVVSWWQGGRAWIPWLAAALLLLAALGVQWQRGLLPSPEAIVTAWTTPWQPTLELLRQARGLFGIGPGSFPDAYLRVMPASAPETNQPHDLFLEVWAMAGPGALLGLVLALGAFFVVMIRAPRAPILDKTPLPTGMAPLRVELYLGGMLGLLLGFVLRAGVGLGEDEIIAQAWPAGIRSLVWFAGYALFERVNWTNRERGLALMAGVAALVLTLLVTSGISYPALTASLWAAIALALNTQAPPPESGIRWRLLALWLPATVPLGITALFVVTTFWPVARATNEANPAQAAARQIFREAQNPPKPVPGKPTPPRESPASALLLRTLFPLQEATQMDPDDVRWRLRLALWNLRLARIDDTFTYRAPSPSVSITGVLYDSTDKVATITTSAAHNFRPGQVVTVRGVTPPPYTFYEIQTVPSATTFTVAISSPPPPYTSGGNAAASGRPLDNGIYQAKRAENLDPESPTPYVLSYHVLLEQAIRYDKVLLESRVHVTAQYRLANMPFVRWLGFEDFLRRQEAMTRPAIAQQEKGTRKAFLDAAHALEGALKRDPSNARLHGLYAEALMYQLGLHGLYPVDLMIYLGRKGISVQAVMPHLAEHREQLKSWKEGRASFWQAIRQEAAQLHTDRQRIQQEAQRALDLDAVTPPGPRRLTDPQRALLNETLQSPDLP
jgi:hypothetical protein